MKLVHLSDLHIGKRVNEFSMLEDQEYILTRALNIIDKEKPDVLIVAGDIYDKSVPSAEAVELFDDFLVRLSKRNLVVMIISGNHDSPERIAFGSQIFDNVGIHISPVYDGNTKHAKLRDEFGNINFYLLPFIKPAHVKAFFPEVEISTYNDALKTVVENMNLNKEERNILITHQFVTGATRSDSEDISVGGSDNVDGALFKDFDYVALGHIHAPQKVLRDTIRYCGSPLKYSFSEANHKKSLTFINLYEKNNIVIETVDLMPKHDMREIKGSYMEVTSKRFYEGSKLDDYLHITLTDEEDIVDAIAKLRVIYPNIMKLDYDNARTRSGNVISYSNEIEKKSPLELFSEFYELQNNQPMKDEQKEFLQSIVEKVWEGNE